MRKGLVLDDGIVFILDSGPRKLQRGGGLRIHVKDWFIDIEDTIQDEGLEYLVCYSTG